MLYYGKLFKILDLSRTEKKERDQRNISVILNEWENQWLLQQHKGQYKRGNTKPRVSLLKDKNLTKLNTKIKAYN